MQHTYGIERDSEHVERRRRCALVRDLTEPDRVLLEWRMVDGWDYATIAIRLGIPRADLVKRVQRIRTGLRRRAKALGADRDQARHSGVDETVRYSALGA
jgi:DNA-directed RNA polymerase specialized sigma24 family protein